ncbi:MAG: hypothetical protein J5663_05025 [Bacteroidaceae bacterium]|nr:hypothetical protein [Bacteroidaceae bacterium]
MEIQWIFGDDDTEKQRRTSGEATENERSIDGQMSETYTKGNTKKNMIAKLSTKQ